MSIPPGSQKEVEAMPLQLRALLEAELAAGNEIVEVGHTFPAPPAGAYFRLAKPLLTQARKSVGDLIYYDRNGSIYSGEITDAKRFYFLLEPPRPPEPESDMDAIRAAAAPKAPLLQPVTAVRSAEGSANAAESSVGDVRLTPLQRFRASMVMHYDKWHDGIGYDLEALGEMSPEERASCEASLIRRAGQDWRDIEALAFLDTPAARAAMGAAINSSNPEVRSAIIRFAAEVITEASRIGLLVRGLETEKFFYGLRQTLDQVAVFHPAPIVDALFCGVLARSGDIAVHFAAMLCFIHGKAPEPFDMEQRPFFLRFNTAERAERAAVFRELCHKLGVDGSRFLAPVAPEFTVEVDHWGEMLTYREATRSATVICTFEKRPCILPRTLTDWFYPADRRSEKMEATEKKIILARIADDCRQRHKMTDVTFET